MKILKDFINIHILFYILALSLLSLGQADADFICGTVYTDEGTTNIGANKTVRIKVNGAGDYTDETNTNGLYCNGTVAADAGDVITVFLDDETEDGTSVTKSHGGDYGDFNIYQNHIIARHDNGSNISIANMANYDKDQDADILFDAETAGPDTLTVDPDNVFYIWPNSAFFPEYNTFPIVNVDDIKIAALATYYTDYMCATTNVSGSWINLGTYDSHTDYNWCGSVTFDADQPGTHTITSGGDAFYNLTFSPSASVTYTLEDALEVDNDLTIVSGTLDVNSNYSITVEGDWSITGGTFLARNGLVTFDDDTPNSRTITTGNSAFYALTFSPSNASTPTLLTTYTLQDALDVDNDLSIMTGTFDTSASGTNSITVGGDWSKDPPSTFVVNNSTVTFDGTGAQSVTTGGADWNEIEVTNSSSSGVTFSDNFTSTKLTCTTPDAHLTFKSGETFVISADGGLDLEGADGQPIVLSATNPGSQWTINPSEGSWTVFDVDVKDSINADPLYINPSDSIDSGNNYNWFYQDACITRISPSDPSIESGGSIEFSAANAACSQTPAYTWSYTSASIGSTISANGLYIAGTNNTGNPVEEDVKVTDTANSVNDTVTVCVGKDGCSVAVSPSAKTLASRGTIQFSAANTGCAQGSFTWELTSSIGSRISTDGLYTAGTNSGADTFVDTITLTDTSNCVIDTATVTIPGYSPPALTTTVPAPTSSTTTTSITTTPTTTSTISATTTTPVPCALRLTPQATTVTQGETITFEVTSSGECDTNEYEWSLSSNTDSSIESMGATCVYTAGENYTSDPLTDTIIVQDIANGEITASATVTLNSEEEVLSLRALPDSLAKTLFLPYPAWLSLEGTGTHFDPLASVITLDPPTALWPLFTLVTDSTNIISFILVMPAWFAGSDNETVTITVTTGDISVSATVDIEFVPSMMGEENNIQ